MRAEPKGNGNTIRYISLGAGVQSSALYICSEKGLNGVPRADVAIFADTVSEPSWVYDTLNRLQEWGSIPIEIVKATEGGLAHDLMHKAGSGGGDRFASIPGFTPSRDNPKKESMLRRQCTREYKVQPITKKVRQLLGYKPRQRIPKGSAVAMIGISLEEVYRMRASNDRWVENVYPLVDARMYRSHCRDLVSEHLGFLPKRSACTFCPYRRNEEWLDVRENDPKGWELALAVDDAIRDLSRAGVENQVFLHRSLKPLREVDFGEADGQADLFNNECEGMCGV